MFAQGLARYEIDAFFRASGGRALPGTLLEVDQLAYLKAMRHWHELGAPRGVDFFSDPRFRGRRNLAVRMDAGVDEFYALWARDLDAFLKRIADRRRRLGLPTRTLADFARNGGKPALALKAYVESGIAGERRDWNKRKRSAPRPRRLPRAALSPMPTLQALKGAVRRGF